MEQFNQKMSEAAVNGADRLAQKLEAAAASRVSAAQSVQQVNVSHDVRCLDAVEPRTAPRAARPKHLSEQLLVAFHYNIQGSMIL